MDRITFDEKDPSAKPRIRGLGITVWEVYRALRREGSEDKVLARYPELDRDDLAAVKAHIANKIRARTHDEITGRRILSKENLVHGEYYKGRCRNATVARWNADEQCFYHWREKFGRIYIETIKYPTDADEPWWDVFDVVEELPNPKFTIPFDEKAVFSGQRADLYEYTAEMWGRIGRV